MQDSNRNYTDAQRIKDAGYQSGDKVWVTTHILNNATRQDK